jgi:hypothetical protein
MVDDVDLVVGVDTHLDTHTAAICGPRGRLLAERQVPTTPTGYTDLVAWVREAAGRVGRHGPSKAPATTGWGCPGSFRPTGSGW